MIDIVLTDVPGRFLRGVRMATMDGVPSAANAVVRPDRRIKLNIEESPVYLFFKS